MNSCGTGFSEPPAATRPRRILVTSYNEGNRILIADDDPVVRGSLTAVLCGETHTCSKPR